MADPNFISDHTYDYANSKWNFMGTGRSDQQIFNDRAVTDALGEGKNTFVNSNGLEQTVSSYSRNSVAPRANSPLANMSKAPTVAGILGAGLGMLTSGLISGPLGMVAGQGVNAAVNSMFNTPEDVPTGKNSNYTPSAVTSSPLGPPGIDGDDGLWYDEGNNAQAEYEAAANAMEFPDNTPAGAISTLAGIGSGLLGGLQGKDEFGVYGQDSDFATNAADENSFEGYDGSEFGGSGSLGTSYGGMETPGLLGSVVSVPSTVASVGEVGDSAPNTGLYTGWPGATPGFSSLSQHTMSAGDFIAMANMSDANSMAAKTGNAYNNFAANFAKNNPNSGYNDRQNAWEASRTAAIEAATALAKNEAAAANIDAGGGGSDGFDGGYGGGFDFSGGVDGIGEAGDSHSGWY